MTAAEIRDLYAYNEWANARVVEVIAGLPADRLTAPIESSFPSILGTFAHIVAAEWVWLRRWLGENPAAFPDWLAAPSFGPLREKLAEVEAERAAFLDALGDHDLERPLDYRTLAGTPFCNRLADLLVHVVNHSSYHRGQLTTMFRQVGASPVATDFVVFKREAGR
jgi:uncharacterized damage-inducible protein DinB